MQPAVDEATCMIRDGYGAVAVPKRVAAMLKLDSATEPSRISSPMTINPADSTDKRRGAG